MKPVATIFDPRKVINKYSEKNNATSPNGMSQRTPRKRLHQQDQYKSFISNDSVKDFKCLNEKLP